MASLISGKASDVLVRKGTAVEGQNQKLAAAIQEQEPPAVFVADSGRPTTAGIFSSVWRRPVEELPYSDRKVAERTGTAVEQWLQSCRDMHKRHCGRLRLGRHCAA